MAFWNRVLFSKDKGVGGEVIHSLVFNDATGEVYVEEWADEFSARRGFSERYNNQVALADYLNREGSAPRELERLLGDLAVDDPALGGKLIAAGVFKR